MIYRQKMTTQHHDILSDKNGVGALILSSKTGRVLLNLRAGHKSHPTCWSLWGGMMESGESPKETLLRELSEEMGQLPTIIKLQPFDVYRSGDGHFKYFSFVCIVADEFVPVLNSESAGYCWLDLGVWPKPMHQGAKISFGDTDALSKLQSILKEIQAK